MYAFREANRKGDARTRIDQRVEGERVLSERGALRRRGVGEAALKKDLAIDLMALVNTIDLDSAEDMDGLDFARKSVLNFGLPDVAHITSDELAVRDIGDNLKAALLHFEPRLYADALVVERDEVFDEVNQRIRFVVSGEMACTPFDVPIDFVAEVEVSSGKVQLMRLPVTT
ncbi:MAG: GPW/gp25 family protein [Rhizobiaceae bacterium]|nr:GPW/gp25 family protein [Rhizobiaceae bacterium]